MTSLSVRGLTVLRQRRMALEDVAFSAAAGAITAVLGGTGSGKTTLLAAIAGLLPAERGAVMRGGVDLLRLPPRRRGIALMPPGETLASARTIPAALRRMAPRGARATRLPAILSRLGLDGVTAAPDAASHGMAALAMAAARLLPDGEVLLVDEAASGLGSADAARVHDALRAAADAGRVVVIATRDPAVARWSDHLVLLHEGRAIQAGTPASLYAEPRDALAAWLTGPANILSGRLREIRGLHFLWANGGRFLQAADPGMPRPALGADVTICLRPERIMLLLPGETADNLIEGTIADGRAAGPLLAVRVMTGLGEIAVLSPSWQPRVYPAKGQPALCGWAADAGWVLP